MTTPISISVGQVNKAGLTKNEYRGLPRSPTRSSQPATNWILSLKM